jgi:hypothetical protein
MAQASLSVSWWAGPLWLNNEVPDVLRNDDAFDISKRTKSKAPDRSGAPLPAAGVHPANSYYSHLATYFLNKLRPALG